MSFDIFINFDGNCREAVEFYAHVFNSEVKDLMTYSEIPPGGDQVIPEEDRNKIMYSCVPILGSNVMFMDMPTGMPLVTGNNINPTIGTKDHDEVRRIFNALKQGGTVEMEPQKTFWSPLYGLVTDKFGIIWHIMAVE